jgi:hypothetical protein
MDLWSKAMARHERLEKCSICNRLRLTTLPHIDNPARNEEPFPSKFAHLRNYVSDGNGVTAYSTSEFRIER